MAYKIDEEFSKTLSARIGLPVEYRMWENHPRETACIVHGDGWTWPISITTRLIPDDYNYKRLEDVIVRCAKRMIIEMNEATRNV